MTLVHRDDVTGDDHQRDDALDEFGIITGDMTYATFDTVHPIEVGCTDHVDDVAEELHELVDEWAENASDHIEANQ